MDKRPIGGTGLKVTPICFGTSGLGDMPATYGYSVDEDRARATVTAILDGPVNMLDTSNNYGFGRSEERIGAVIRERGGLPDGFVLATKLDRDMTSGRFDADRVRRSVEESLTRLGLDRLDLLHLHDPEYARDLNEITGKGGALEELFKLKAEGLVRAVGLAMGRIDMMFPILRAWPFDALVSHNRMTLVNRSADAMFDYAHGAGMAILNAAPFAGGVLAKGSAVMPRLTYQEASDENSCRHPPDRGDLRRIWHRAGGGGIAVFDARPARDLDHRGRQQARARPAGAGLGLGADPAGGMGRAGRVAP